MGVVRLVNFREVIDDRLPCGLVVTWAWWLEVELAHGDGSREGVMLIAGSEEVKVPSKNEEIVLGIRLDMASIRNDGALDAKYLRGR